MILARLNLLVAVVVAALLAAPGAAVAQYVATQSSTYGDSQILVMRNGSVLRGVVIDEGDTYLLRIAKGAELRVPASTVQLVCSNLEEAYRQLGNAQSAADISARLKLGQWCLRHRLWDQAGRELAAAERLGPDDRRVKLLRRRLVAASASARAAARPPAEAPKRKSSAEIAIARRSLESAAALSTDEVSGGVVRGFVSSVQPLLINRCAAGACHGGSSRQEFTLKRPPLGSLATAWLTRRNLAKTLAWVETSAPRQSRLLEMSRKRHGGAPASLGAVDVRAYQLLEQWVEAAAAGKNFDRPATIIAPRDALSQTPPRDMQSARTVSRAIEEMQLARPLPREGQASLKRDPFDPAIFNRRFFPDRARVTFGFSGTPDAEEQKPLRAKNSQDAPSQNDRQNRPRNQPRTPERGMTRPLPAAIKQSP